MSETLKRELLAMLRRDIRKLRESDKRLLRRQSSDLISDDPVYRAAMSGMDEIERGLTT